MSNKIELIELYLPDALAKYPDQEQEGQVLSGWNFLVNYSTTKELSHDLEFNLSHYFFNDTNQSIPYAALCAYFFGLDNQNQSFWIKADPVHYALDMNKGFIVPSEFITENNAKLVLLVNEFLSQDSLEFNIIDKQNGLIKSNTPIELITPNLINIINQPIKFEHISGQGKKYWQQLSAELQLLFNQHKTVETEPSGLYFWGAGKLPIEKPQSQFNKIISNDYAILGLAKLAGVDFEKLDLNKNLNLDFMKESKILISTQDFSLHYRSGKHAEFIDLSVYFDKVLLELINMIKKNQLKKLVLNTGEKTYQLTKSNIIKSYFTRWFKVLMPVKLDKILKSVMPAKAGIQNKE